MRRLFLAGKAMPEDKSARNVPFPSGDLESLVALDPRHGVFPNLVATTVLSTLMAFYEDRHGDHLHQMLEQAEEILKDRSKRRFNILCKPRSSTLTLHPTVIAAI